MRWTRSTNSPESPRHDRRTHERTIAVQGMANLRGMTGTVSYRTHAINRVAELMLKERPATVFHNNPTDGLGDEEAEK